MRLDKLLANMGFGSRKDVKIILKKNQVTVNNDIVRDGRIKIDPYEDHVKVNDQEVEYRKFIYIMMNKASGYISATEDMKEKTVIDLLSDEIKKFKPFPIGRLDKDTEGLLLITNDGKLAHHLTSPKRKIEKTYYAKIEGVVTHNDIENLAQGIKLKDGYFTEPAELNILDSGDVSEIELTLTEGKYHQVKRMIAALGKHVVYLKRIRLGKVYLDESIPLGSYRELTKKELNDCLSL